MATTHKLDNEQTSLWNGSSGHAWVDAQELLDYMFKPMEDLLVNAVTAESGSRVLDIGCGTGSTTLATARQPGIKYCTGIDISAPMITAARGRAKQGDSSAVFICADAQTHTFEPASFDRIISRFGVMFFDDPVQAFVNLRRAASADAKLDVIAWRDPMDNPFMTAAEHAAAPLLPNLPARQPNEPGQFAFADQGRVHHILEQSGWVGIDIQPIDVPCTFPEPDLVPYLSHLGPVGRTLQEADDRVREQVIEIVRAAFEPYVHGNEVRFTAACWRVVAKAGSRCGQETVNSTSFIPPHQHSTPLDL